MKYWLAEAYLLARRPWASVQLKIAIWVTRERGRRDAAGLRRWNPARRRIE